MCSGAFCSLPNYSGCKRSRKLHKRLNRLMILWTMIMTMMGDGDDDDLEYARIGDHVIPLNSPRHLPYTLVKAKVRAADPAGLIGSWQIEGDGRDDNVQSY